MAPVNPNIALSVRPFQLEFQQRSPLQEYAQVQQIQNAQLQNQLARQQMEQEQGVTNYLRTADLATPEGRAGLRRFGKTGLGYEKLIAEQETNALKRKELEGKLREQQMTALGTGLTSVLVDPSDANLTAAFDRLDATGIDTRPFREQFANMPDLAARKTAITQYVTSNPEGRQALAFVQPKPEKIDLNGRVAVIDMNPNSPTYQQEVKQFAKTMAPGEAQRLENEATRIKQEGQRIGLEGRRVAVLEENARRDADPAFQQRINAAKATGEAIAKGDVAATQALPKIIGRAEEGVRLIDELIGKRDSKTGQLLKGEKPHPGFQNAVGATWLPGARFVPGTDAAGFMSRFDQIKGASFLEAFESLKGGGAITEKEGQKGTDAINRMSTSTDEKEFIRAALDLQDVIRKGVENAQKRAARTGDAAPTAPAAGAAGNVIDFGSLR